MLNWEEVRQISESSVSRGNLGDLNFSAAWGPALKMQKIFLSFEHILDIPRNDQINIQNDWTTYKSLLNEITNYSQGESETLPNARTRRDKLVSGLKTFSESASARLAAIYVFSDKAYQYATRVAGDLDAKTKNLNQEQDRLRQNFDSQVSAKIQEINQKTLEVNQLKDSLEKFSTKEVAKKYGKVFESQARFNLFLALASMAILGTTVYFLVRYIGDHFLPILEKMSILLDGSVDLKSGEGIYAYLVMFLVVRLVVVSLFALVIFVALKNFNVNMNLYNINKHRQNSLLSSEILAKLTTDSELRSKIIEQVAETVYSHQPTGQMGGFGKKVSFSEIAEFIKAIR